jgi:hypothetical protein
MDLIASSITEPDSWAPNRSRCRTRADRLHESATLAGMKLLLFFFVALLLIGGGMKLLGAELPVLDYPLGGPMTQPNIEVVQPDITLP